ncbi:monoglyceride lipase-like [Quillaja saponaria]|uniref:Monoglyceride lipase-like n=1 Tax=Quillaja saponaria TaxID=32244 RepID=A0AAD7Q5L0_QUISA|nr:monoglyceride lipase-like [Quillaja saponaria]
MAIEPIIYNGNDGSSSPSSLILTSGATGRVNALFSLRALKILLMLVNAVVLFLLLPFRGRKRVPMAEKPNMEEKQPECHRKGLVVRLPMPTTIVPWKSSSSVNTIGSTPVMTAAAVVLDQEVTVRRSMAIRRMLEDGDKNTVREYWLMATMRGETIFTQSWTPVSVKIRGLVLLLHGLNEHSGRYSDFAKQLNASGYKVYGMDWIGHGGSDGLHSYVHSLDDAVADMKLFLDKVLTENPGLPMFLLWTLDRCSHCAEGFA